MNFYPHHISDFNNSTRHLTRVERSVYRDAIEMYYDTESVLTSDISRLEKKLICRTDEEKTALKDILYEFFELNEDGYYHERCNTEVEKYRANTSAKARAGIASAKARKQKATERKRNSTPVKLRSTNQEPRTINQEPLNKEKDKKKKPSVFVAPEFNDVIEYSKTRNRTDLAKTFFDFFHEGNWIDSNGNQVKNWKQKFITWESRSPKQTNQIDDNDTSWIEGIRQ